MGRFVTVSQWQSDVRGLAEHAECVGGEMRAGESKDHAVFFVGAVSPCVHRNRHSTFNIRSRHTFCQPTGANNSPEIKGAVYVTTKAVAPTTGKAACLTTLAPWPLSCDESGWKWMGVPTKN